MVLVENNKDNIKQVKKQFIDKIADNMNSFGVSTSVGRVLGIIYMQGAPMTLDELSDETGMSKTRMSQVVREMIDLNIAERVFQKGVRKDLYQVEQDYYQTFTSLFTATWQKAVHKSRHFETRLQNKVEQIQESSDLTDADKANIDNIESEIDEWAEYFEWIKRLTEFFDSGEIFKYVPKNKQGGNHHA